MSGGNFDQVVVVDFEFEADAGELPQPLCMSAYVLNENLQHLRTIHLWRGEFGSAPPFDIGPDTLVVGAHRRYPFGTEIQRNGHDGHRRGAGGGHFP